MVFLNVLFPPFPIPIAISCARTVARQHYDLNRDPTVAADEPGPPGSVGRRGQAGGFVVATRCLWLFLGVYMCLLVFTGYSCLLRLDS